VQPVPSFNPITDVNDVCTHVPAHVPPINDSDRPAEGIVRSFPITRVGRVWGQYSLKKIDPAVPADVNGDSKVRDLSFRRGLDAVGLAWQLESEGIVYVQTNGDEDYDVDVDKVLARRTLRTEIFRFTADPSVKSALCAERYDRVFVQAQGTRIRGGSEGYGVAATPGTGALTNPNNPTTGIPAITGGLGNSTQTIPLSNYSIKNVFGVTEQELLNMADDVVTTVADLPTRMPDMGLIVIRGNAVFTTTRPLNGSGVLVVLDGNLTIPAGTLWSGFIYVRGDYTQNAPSAINGQVVAVRRSDGTGANVRLVSTGDFADLSYDESFIEQILLQMGRYRYSRSTYMP
jgi:hypothetical protein